MQDIPHPSDAEHAGVAAGEKESGLVAVIGAFSMEDDGNGQ